ncbi:unnamed protein product [Polarella glacialis]|uniref:Uncharacterized protein n=1 Tax=Polarella glacialis TaxID=89957 RepID=A0A813G2X5_POLGL|nr:unnamed protein product [Polarella glacialis]
MGKGSGSDKLYGICGHGGLLYCCPLGASEVPVVDPTSGSVSFIDTGKGSGGNKWIGTSTAACSTAALWVPQRYLFWTPRVAACPPSTRAREAVAISSMAFASTAA